MCVFTFISLFNHHKLLKLLVILDRQRLLNLINNQLVNNVPKKTKNKLLYLQLLLLKSRNARKQQIGTLFYILQLFNKLFASSSSFTKVITIFYF